MKLTPRQREALEDVSSSRPSLAEMFDKYGASVVGPLLDDKLVRQFDALGITTAGREALERSE